MQTDDQEVTRTIGDLKVLADQSWWSGFGSGILALACGLGLLFAVGLHNNW